MTAKTRTKNLARRLAALGNSTYQQAIGHVQTYDETFGADATNRWIATHEIAEALRADDFVVLCDDTGHILRAMLRGTRGRVRHAINAWTLAVDLSGDTPSWTVTTATATDDTADVWASAYLIDTNPVTFAAYNAGNGQAVRDAVVVATVAIAHQLRDRLARPADHPGSNIAAGTAITATRWDAAMDPKTAAAFAKAAADIAVDGLRADGNWWYGPIPTNDNLHDLCDANMVVHDALCAIYDDVAVDGNSERDADRFNAAFDALMGHPGVDPHADPSRIDAYYRSRWGRDRDGASPAPFTDETFLGAEIDDDGDVTYLRREGAISSVRTDPVMATIREAFYHSDEAADLLWSMQDGMPGIDPDAAGWDWSALRDSTVRTKAERLYPTAAQWVTTADLARAWGIDRPLIDRAVTRILASLAGDPTEERPAFIFNTTTGQVSLAGPPPVNVPDTPEGL